MRPYIFFIALFFSSCGLVANIKRDKFIKSKGFNPTKDTAIFKPYQFYIKHKGMIPVYRELTNIQPQNKKISIQGAEHSDTILFEKLFETMNFSVVESADSVLYGELYFSREAVTSIIRFGSKFPGNCACKASFDFIKEKRRKLHKRDVLFFWNVQVVRDGVTYTLPSRVYHLK